MLKLLTENKNLRFLWLAQLISALGERLTQMGILTFVMVVSGDKGSKMALITFFNLLPFLLFAPLFGALIDRYSRKRLMLLADILRAVLVGLIPVLWINTHSVGLAALAVFSLGSLSALFVPARMGILGNITDKETLLPANSLIVTTGMTATLAGTLIAGTIIKVTGVQFGFYLNAITYLISAILIARILYQKPKSVISPGKNIYFALGKDIKAGASYIARHKIILRLIFLNCVFSCVSSFAYILILNYSRLVLALDALGMGIMLAGAGLGMITGAAILFKRKDKVNYKRALYLSHFIIGLFLLVFIFGPGLYLSLLSLFCAGIGAAILTIALDTIFQRVSPDELKGKIFAARGVLTNAVFLSCLLAVGWLIKFISPEVLFGAIGSFSLFIALVIFLAEQRWGYQGLRLFLRLLMRILFDFRVSGLENIPKSRKVILAGNHSSVIDGVSLLCAYQERVYFLAADSLFKLKFWGWCAGHLGYIPIKRGGFNKESISQAVEILKSGYSIGIFPEGKIAQDGRLTEGKPGVALIARLAGCDIVPFAIEGAYEAWPLPKKFPRRFPVEVRFGKPIDISVYPIAEELVNEVMAEIAKIKLSLEREGYLSVEPDDIIRHLINIG